jgi:hypothetical protein
MSTQLYEGEHTDRDFHPSKIDEIEKRLDGYPVTREIQSERESHWRD